MKDYIFYIENGKAIARPVGGGTIGPLGGQHYSQAINVQSQGNKVIVTYEDGAVTEHPWPLTGGLTRFIVQPKHTVKSSYTENVQSSAEVYSDEPSQASYDAYAPTEKKSCIARCFGCLVRIIVLCVILFVIFIIAGAIINQFSKKGEKTNSNQINKGREDSKTTTMQTIPSDAGRVSKEEAPVTKNGIIEDKINSISTFENVSLPLDVIVIEKCFLLDAAGKEREIAIGTRLKIVNRKPKGTLEIVIAGGNYVGHEYRITEKVKLP